MSHCQPHIGGSVRLVESILGLDRIVTEWEPAENYGLTKSSCFFAEYGEIL